MKAPIPPPDELQRLRELRGYDVLDTARQAVADMDTPAGPVTLSSGLSEVSCNSPVRQAELIRGQARGPESRLRMSARSAWR